MLKKFVTFASLMLALIAFAAPASAKKHKTPQWKNCQIFLNTGTGEPKRTRWYAKVAAKAAWRSKVRKLYGLKWVSWTLASSKQYKCKKIGRRTTCKVTARACSL